MGAYKAYMRGISIKLASVTRKKRQAKVDTLLQRIHVMETLNKNQPSVAHSSALMADRLEL